jgi:hypothetical protein
MTSIVFNSAINYLVRGAIDFQDDAFSVMLCTADYRVNKRHASRSEVTNEVIGEGYDAGGIPVEVTVAMDAKNNCVNVLLGAASWSFATIKARYGVYYRKGGELIAAIDFGKDVVSTDGTFSLSASTLRFQN